jgi:hypothetical protein
MTAYPFIRVESPERKGKNGFSRLANLSITMVLDLFQVRITQLRVRRSRNQKKLLTLSL